MSQNVRMSPKKRRAAALVAEGRTVRDTATEIGVNERTVYRWREESEFLAEVDRLLADSQARALRILRAKAPRAAEILAEVAEMGGRDQAHRAKAAEAILNRVGLPAGKVLDLNVAGDFAGVSDEELEEIVRKAATEIAGGGDG